ncbi:putative membrane protein [Wickerhamomyces ciferrii]|uniref:Membrane protein n=1 Tax=Wickerhamomyces ciferrii (strain ATCC 14091 / BCRC 22168 / CBS 111 / JCM 3599 / NBRC 0793 / NRRL Y-1031 F-60-10) TaxID=1206466 RepID=K0KDE2_WICCF|nr:uncharacterized protein BN7_2677 [Wickerhamomyces ciferrii]CCH43130.1 putative membrane protein [Wickerhamomyces ciferrii]
MSGSPTDYVQVESLEAKLVEIYKEQVDQLANTRKANLEELKEYMRQVLTEIANDFNEKLDTGMNEMRLQNTKLSSELQDKLDQLNAEIDDPFDSSIDPDLMKQLELLEQSSADTGSTRELIFEISKIIAQQTQLILLPHLTELLFFVLAYFMVSDFPELVKWVLLFFSLLIMLISTIRYNS